MQKLKLKLVTPHKAQRMHANVTTSSYYEKKGMWFNSCSVYITLERHPNNTSVF